MKDTLGRENRKIADKRCLECGKVYRPKRESAKYCSYACMWKNNGKNQGQKTDHEAWWINPKGYEEGRVWRNGKAIRIKRARWIMEQHLDRPLKPNEIVHHKNENKLDNRIENLEIKGHGEHTTDHHKGKRKKRGYKVNISPEERTRRSEFMKEVHRRRKENDPTNSWYGARKIKVQ